MSGLMSSSNAYAADAETQATSGGLEEIIVTARGRKEAEVQVPISIQTFSADQLAQDGVQDLQGLTKLAGFTFQQGVSTEAGGREWPSLIMRGLQSTYGGGIQDSGAVFVDGIYVSAGLASINTSDVSQVEVLKGPQEVYFGKGTFGGAINFITANPSSTFGGSVDASGSALGSSDVKASIEGPLVTDLLSARLSIQDTTKAAQYHATDGGDLGAENSRSVSATLFATPTDSLWFRFRGHYQEDNDSAADVGYLQGGVYGSKCAAGSGKGTNAQGQPITLTLPLPYFCGSIPSLAQTGNGVLDVNTALPAAFAAALEQNKLGNGADPVLGKVPSLGHSGLRRNLEELSAQGGYEFPNNWNLAFNLGYNGVQSNDIWDLDHSTYGIYINERSVVSSDWMADVKLTTDQSQKLRGLIGGSYFHEVYETSKVDDNYYGVGSNLGSTFFPSYLAPYTAYSGPVTNYGNYSDEIDRTQSLFASVEYDIFSWLTATAEARYQVDTVIDRTDPATGIYKKSFVDYLPRFSLKYHPEKDWDFYATYSEGIQAPLLETGFIQANAAQQKYISSVAPGVSAYSPIAKLRNYEIGAKQDLFNGRLDYSLSLYMEKWTDQETTASLFNGPGCTGINLTAACPLSSAGAYLYLPNNATIKGVEFSASALPIEKLRVDASVDFKDATWDRYNNSTLTFWTGTPYYNGNSLSRVPDVTASLGLTYTDSLIGDWKWYGHSLVYYQGPMWESDVNVAQSNAYARVNLSAGLLKGNLRLEAYVTNLLDDKNWDWVSRVPNLASSTFAYSTDQGLLVQAPDRRDFGLKAHYKF
jgi:iron complex outermembrane receptor protein